jgi:hypothetical protein
MFWVLNHKTGHWFQLKNFQLRLNHRLLGTLSQVRKDVPSFDYSTITRSICNRDQSHTEKMKFGVNAQRVLQISLGVFQIIICLQVPLVGLCFCNAYKYVNISIVKFVMFSEFWKENVSKSLENQWWNPLIHILDALVSYLVFITLTWMKLVSQINHSIN